MDLLRNQRGFTLIELVTTLILVGMIGAFTGLFLHTGLQGFLTSKNASETALKAQVALDRISAELRFVESLPAATPPVPNVSITYTSRDLPGTRKISFDSTSKAISITVDNSAHVLLNNVQTFNLALTPGNLDAIDGEEVAAIKIGFTTVEIGTPFEARIYPRGMLAAP
jgi:prepilin-type N-terminal cleavage/methylation domain-containing protein